MSFDENRNKTDISNEQQQRADGIVKRLCVCDIPQQSHFTSKHTEPNERQTSYGLWQQEGGMRAHVFLVVKALEQNNEFIISNDYFSHFF